ncbi:MAG TPA: methyltransferase domain-containing protein [Candidatus Acidoferrales bacterium]|nr:methyltransferase domain-containing protein [Candidatus Acidoferrales bacterium]
MSESQRQIPYIDFLIERLERGETVWQKAFGLHVHWGYWPDPRSATASIDDFAQAAERLGRLVCDAAGVTDGMRVLDVGCGFGGTLASLGARFEGLDLWGLNIDYRQLERARRQAIPRARNRLQYVAADACLLPFANESFDALLAVECIFHFSSRRRFLREARRVLRPGGRLAFSDFVPRVKTLPLLALMFAFFRSAVVKTYGDCNLPWSIAKYHRLAGAAGFASIGCEDITANTLPTYVTLRRMSLRLSRHAAAATRFLEWASRAGWLRYLVLGFERKA